MKRHPRLHCLCIPFFCLVSFSLAIILFLSDGLFRYHLLTISEGRHLDIAHLVVGLIYIVSLFYWVLESREETGITALFPLSLFIIVSLQVAAFLVPSDFHSMILDNCTGGMVLVLAFIVTFPHCCRGKKPSTIPEEATPVPYIVTEVDI